MKQLNVEELKEHQLSILKQVDSWCREHDVQYFLGYGTLLGAVRHQGPPFTFNHPTAGDKLPKAILGLGQFARRCCILQHLLLISL